MTKKFIIIISLMLVCLTGCNEVNQNSDTNVNNIEKQNEVNTVSIGYDEMDKKEIFGDMSDNEIEAFIEEYSKEILENMDPDNLGSEDIPTATLEKYNIDGDKLFIQYNDKSL